MPIPGTKSATPGARTPSLDVKPAAPGSRAAAIPATKPTPAAPDSGGNSAGRIVHDERGNAVWDWLKDTARIAIDSTSRLLRKLEVPDLKIEDTQSHELRVESDRDVGGGYDPYGGSAPTSGRASGSRVPPSASGAGGGANTNIPSGGRHPNRVGAGRDPHGGAPKNAGGGYDPYGKGVTNKPKR